MNINLTLIGQSLAFVVFVWFCMKFVWPPIVTALNDRKTKIADGLAAAEEGQQAKAKAQEHAEQVTSEAKEQAQEIIRRAEKRETEMVEEAKGNARTEGDRIRDRQRSKYGPRSVACPSGSTGGDRRIENSVSRSRC